METRLAIAPVMLAVLAVSGAVFIQLGCENSSVSTCDNVTEYLQGIHQPAHPSPFVQAIDNFLSLWSWR